MSDRQGFRTILCRIDRYMTTFCCTKLPKLESRLPCRAFDRFFFYDGRDIGRPGRLIDKHMLWLKRWNPLAACTVLRRKWVETIRNLLTQQGVRPEGCLVHPQYNKRIGGGQFACRRLTPASFHRHSQHILETVPCDRGLVLVWGWVFHHRKITW